MYRIEIDTCRTRSKYVTDVSVYVRVSANAGLKFSYPASVL